LSKAYQAVEQLADLRFIKYIPEESDVFMRTPPFVPVAEAAFIAGLNDRQMGRVVDENLVPAALLGQQGSARLFARLTAAFARFYFDTEQTLVASVRRDIVEELTGRVQQLDKQRDVLALRVMPTEIN
jgi:hypothetical protein